KEELKLKPRSAWRYIGKDTAGYDLKDLCTGKGVFGQDTHMAGMLYASVLHPPVLGSAVKSVDDKAALLVGGVKQTATIPTFKPPVLYQALGGARGLPRWKGRSLGAHAKPRGRARCHCGSGGCAEGRRDGARYFAGWRVWAKIVPGLRGGGSGALEKNGETGEGRLEPRGR